VEKPSRIPAVEDVVKAAAAAQQRTQTQSQEGKHGRRNTIATLKPEGSSPCAGEAKGGEKRKLPYFAGKRGKIAARMHREMLPLKKAPGTLLKMKGSDSEKDQIPNTEGKRLYACRERSTMSESPKGKQNHSRKVYIAPLLQEGGQSQHSFYKPPRDLREEGGILSAM